jgi:hypothetical protein
MGVRFTDAEREEIAAVAAALDVSAGALIRAGALQAARAGPALLAQEAVAVHRAATELAAVGRALTQIGRRLDEDSARMASDLTVTLEALRTRVIQLDAAHRALLSAHARRGQAARRVLIDATEVFAP